MAKAGKFAALADFRQAQDEPEAATVTAPEPEPTPPAAPPAEPVQEAPKPRGRPPGKRSDPAWKLYSHFLKRKTQREAAALLLDRDDGRDLSDVLQGLLAQWLVEEKRKGA
jgi:hypothetical protein